MFLVGFRKMNLHYNISRGPRTAFSKEWESKCLYIPVFLYISEKSSYLVVGSKAAPGDVLEKKAFLKISEYSQENACDGVSF